MIVDNVVKTLKEKGMYAKKHFGQNFLIDKNVLNKIVSISNITKEDTIIEIGPGMGCLTEYLAINANKVICYEIDKDMIAMLNDTLLPFYDNIEIIGLDFLKADLSLYKDKVENVKVVANLPYYITTPIIFKLLSETKIRQFTFMVQKEVGDRLTGKPNTKDYNSLSVAMKYKTDSKLMYKVSPNSFYPAPKVDSALLLVEVKKVDSDLNFDTDFLKFVQDIFAQRRKTIINNLNGKYSLDKQKLTEIFVKNNLNINLRAETLSVEEILELYKLIVGVK